MLFTEYQIGSMRVSNRFVRSATADCELDIGKEVPESTLQRYRALAGENVGMIITGDFPVVTLPMIETKSYDYKDVHIPGVSNISKSVHEVNRDCRVVAQLSTEAIYFIPSEYVSPWGMEGMHICERDEIEFIEHCFIETALKYQEMGYDGIQLHGAHGGFLSMFLSPYANHRKDDYGGSTENRCRVVTNIICGIKEKAPDFPVLIKINATEYFSDGMNPVTLQETVSQLESAGVDGIEYSGGLWEALVLGEDKLGFPAVPATESHTHIGDISKQSYFRNQVKDLKTTVPVILVGGNRNIALMEEILLEGSAQLISLCRPLLCEPDLITKWIEDPEYKPTCMSCNACIYDMFIHPWEEHSSGVHCMYQMSRHHEEWRQRYKDGLGWIKNWTKENL